MGFDCRLWLVDSWWSVIRFGIWCLFDTVVSVAYCYGGLICYGLLVVLVGLLNGYVPWMIVFVCLRGVIYFGGSFSWWFCRFRFVCVFLCCFVGLVAVLVLPVGFVGSFAWWVVGLI